MTTPVRSANLLSGISTAAQGIEDELANSILGGQDGDILLQAVRKGRKRQREALSAILLGSSSPSIAPNFNQFLIEFSTYHDSCGISYGRQVLRGAVTTATEDEQPSAPEVNTFR